MSTFTESAPVTTERACLSCKGAKTHTHAAFEFQGVRYPASTTTCHACRGRGSFVPPDVAGIVDEIKVRKGLRSKRPDSDRAYYVWRMARFHGGADVTMPVMAASGVRSDPFLKELDAIADAVAKRVYGTDLAGASRWGSLLGNHTAPAGLPATAYPGGPVLTTEKPEEEWLELR